MEQATNNLINVDNYPFVKCLHPINIRSKSGDWMVVGCGHCEACLMRKAQVNKTKCDLEAQSNQYTIFVTLTYNDDNIPTFELNKDDETNTSVHITTPRLSGKLTKYAGDIMHGIDHLDVDFTNLYNRTKIKDKIAFLCKYDLQCFFKRYRKLINQKYGKTEIRYYAVGEYGPQTYRPHYHLLLFTNSREVQENSSKDIRSCWKFGYIDSSLCQGRASSYVTSYVNSNTIIPKVLQQKPFAPFSVHSRHLGEAKLYKAREEVYEMPFEDFITRRCQINNRYEDIRLWRSLTHYYFPKCIQYSSIDARSKYNLYTIYAEAIRYFRTTSLTYISKKLALAIYGHYSWTRNHIMLLDVNYDISDTFIKWFIDYSVDRYIAFGDNVINMLTYDSETKENNLKIIERYVYTVLRTSRHFLEFVCNGDIDSRVASDTVKKYIRKIDDFWTKYDYELLKNDLKNQEMIGYNNKDVEEADLIHLYKFFYNRYDYDLDGFQQLSIAKDYSRKTHEKFEKKIKHKKMNDLSGIFLKNNNY